MLREKTLFEDRDKVKESVAFLQDLEPPEGYYLAFSGGKDSICIKRLADMAGVKYDAHYSVTTIDPPELVRYIRKHHADVGFDHPEKPLLKVVEQKGLPSRKVRWCCKLYKERGGSGRKVITGIRAAESTKRAGRKAVESCYKDSTKMFINPIINWSDDEVWQFIREENLPYCSLYDEGWKRIGCLFCPMCSDKDRQRQLIRYPRYANVFRKAARAMHTNKKDSRPSLAAWKNGDEMFDWWITENRMWRGHPDQTVLFE